MKFLATAFSQLLTIVCIAQISSKEELLKKVANFYQQQNQGCYTIDYRFKSAISEDTSKAKFVCCFSKENNKASKYSVHKLLFGSYLLYSQNNFYSLNIKEKTFKRYSKKEARNLTYRQYVEDYPFYDVSNFLKPLSKESFFLKKDSFCVLSSGSYFYYFDDKSGELKKISQIIPTSDGIQYMEVNLSGLHSENEQLSDLNNQLLLTGYKEAKSNNRPYKALIGKHSIGSPMFDFKMESVDGKTFTNESVQGKYVLFDLFYQSCMPCIQSIPYLNELADSTKYPNLKVIGVDPYIEEASTMSRFIARYKITYPVVTGESGNSFWKSIKNISYPTTILLDTEGRIIYVDDELDRKFLKERIKKLVSPKE